MKLMLDSRTSRRRMPVAVVVTAMAMALVCSLVPVEPAEAQGPRGRGPRGHAAWERLLAAADELDLSTQQQDRLRAIRRSAPAALMPRQQAVAEARLDLADVMARKDANAADLRAAHERLTRARGELATAAFDLRVQTRDVLTPQQREKLQDHKRTGQRGKQRGREMRRGEWAPPAAMDEGHAADAPAPFAWEDESFEEAGLD